MTSEYYHCCFCRKIYTKEEFLHCTVCHDMIIDDVDNVICKKHLDDDDQEIYCVTYRDINIIFCNECFEKFDNRDSREKMNESIETEIKKIKKENDAKVKSNGGATQ